jgi:hypothetical protein
MWAAGNRPDLHVYRVTSECGRFSGLWKKSFECSCLKDEKLGKEISEDT